MTGGAGPAAASRASELASRKECRVPIPGPAMARGVRGGALPRCRRIRPSGGRTGDFPADRGLWELAETSPYRDHAECRPLWTPAVDPCAPHAPDHGRSSPALLPASCEMDSRIQMTDALRLESALCTALVYSALSSSYVLRSCIRLTSAQTSIL